MRKNKSQRTVATRKPTVKLLQSNGLKNSVLHTSKGEVPFESIDKSSMKENHEYPGMYELSKIGGKSTDNSPTKIFDIKKEEIIRPDSVLSKKNEVDIM